jgi:pimeloyl-ACP methyl ester carboxylesterase
MHDQLPFHFGNPLDPRIAEYEARTAVTVYSPRVLSHFASQDYGMIEVEDRLARITQPLLVLTGRLDRTCSVEAAQAIAKGAPHAELVIFGLSGHMTFVEVNARYVQVVREWLGKNQG